MHRDRDDVHHPQPRHQIPVDHTHRQTPATRPSKYRFQTPSSRRTSPFTWLIAALCAIFWVLVFLGGLAVLIVYLAFRPRSPRVDIPSVTLNAGYLDMGAFLNADVTILANFTNPNHKVDVSFAYLDLDLYFNGTLVATQAVDPFVERRGESALRSVHMVTSEVELPPRVAEAWRQQVADGRVSMEVRGVFRTTSYLGRFLHFTYWLYGHCSVVVGPPPTGVLLAKQCRTKR